jgi:cellobiose phosphorylase
LRIDPCIPKAWSGFTVSREFRGARYDIEVRNPRGVCKGVKSLVVDGKRVAGDLIPPAPAGTRVKVLAELG